MIAVTAALKAATVGALEEVTDDLRLVVLLDPGGVALAADRDRVLRDPAEIVGGAPPGVPGDDPGDQGVEAGNVSDRCRELPHCGLCDALLNEISHSVLLLPSLMRAKNRYHVSCYQFLPGVSIGA